MITNIILNLQHEYCSRQIFNTLKKLIRFSTYLDLVVHSNILHEINQFIYSLRIKHAQNIQNTM